MSLGMALEAKSNRREEKEPHFDEHDGEHGK
jgi:hypothetical protein